MAAPVILVTGFEPFGGESVNVSWEVARALDGSTVAGARVVALRLPCVFGLSLRVLGTALRRHGVQWVLAIGQAAGRAELSLERVAVNVDDARIADNAGASPVDQPVVRRGPVAYFSTLPIKAMAAAAMAAGVPAGISQTAGTFVCNHVFYGLQHRLRRTAVRSGFLHLPLMPEQSASFPDLPVLPLEDQIRGTRAALQAALQWERGADLRQTGGAVA